MSKNKLQINDNLNEINISKDIVLLKGKRTQTVNAWYEIAADNLSSAKVLFENKCVNHAVFFIQQSVECIVKGLFLEAGILNADIIRYINHNPSDAFEKLYKKIDYEQGLEYCRQIPEMLNKRSSFEEKMILVTSLANKFTSAFKEFMLAFQSNIISFDTSRYESSVIDYYVTEKCYYQNILLLFSCLFTHKVESNARYLTAMNNNVILPKQMFSTPQIIERLPSFIAATTTLKDYFVGQK